MLGTEEFIDWEAEQFVKKRWKDREISGMREIRNPIDSREVKAVVEKLAKAGKMRRKLLIYFLVKSDRLNLTRRGSHS